MGLEQLDRGLEANLNFNHIIPGEIRATICNKFPNDEFEFLRDVRSYIDSGVAVEIILENLRGCKDIATFRASVNYAICPVSALKY